MNKPKRSPLIIPEDSPTTDLIELMGVEPVNRESFIKTNWMGDYAPDDFPDELEDDLPLQFRRATLLETPPMSEEIQ